MSEDKLTNLLPSNTISVSFTGTKGFQVTIWDLMIGLQNTKYKYLLGSMTIDQKDNESFFPKKKCINN